MPRARPSTPARRAPAAVRNAANATGGGGGGHHGDGGDSEIGSGGKAFAPPADVLADAGARGAGGSAGAAAGAGGGAIGIRAAETATVDGTLLVNGGDGEDLELGEDEIGQCNRVGAGGGSGGRIHIEAKRVLGTGAMHAGGGSGGDGIHGGGGGSGGRSALDAIDRTLAAGAPAVTANAGSGGGHGQCTTEPRRIPTPTIRAVTPASP